MACACSGLESIPLGAPGRLPPACRSKTTCELTTSGGDAQLSVKTTGKDDFATIDPIALPGFIQRFGALCNEIFAGLGA